MKFGKKGSELWVADKMLYTLLFIAAVGFTAIIVISKISKTGAEQTIINENIKSLNIMQRFIESPDCFIYSKDGIILSRVIDFNKFSNERLNSNICYNTDKSVDKSTFSVFPAYKITLKSDTQKPSQLPKSIKTNNFEEEVGYKSKNYNVQIHSDDGLYNGELIIDVQNV